MTMKREVESEYRESFEEFSKKAQRVQSMTVPHGTDGKALDSALLELEKAHLAYNQARDAFIESLLPASAHLPAADDKNRPRDVPAIAELIWEGAGRPEGTAQEDWRRAEAIVKCAIATADHD
jgi:hypothetical protein